MNVQQAYNKWSETYDSVENKTRDLEARALREYFADADNLCILEIGCGTGKNTEFLQKKAENLTAVDFSLEMLAKAREKITAANVEFQQLDLRETWDFPANSFDLITCSLALEHIENLDFIFGQAQKVLRSGGRFYIGELHPFKQYLGTKARFETGSGVFELECFVHYVSDFFGAATKNNFNTVDLKEWFDGNERSTVPRLLTMLFEARS